MTPYYQHAGITIYHGDCREVLPSVLPGVGINPAYDLLCTDPPYGIGADRNLRANKQHGKALAASRDYGEGNWDGRTPSQETIQFVRDCARWQIIWGGNYFHLPPSRAWLVWDKENGNNGYADCELAWTNLDKAVRRKKYQWMGMLQEHMDRKEERVHPTQKPEEVMRWAIGQAPSECQSIIDPFMGSGTTLCAAKDLGRRAIGIEIEEKYCEIAAKRLQQESMFQAESDGESIMPRAYVAPSPKITLPNMTEFINTEVQNGKSIDEALQLWRETKCKSKSRTS